MKQEVIQTQAMQAERSKVVLNMRHKATHKDLHHLEKKTPMRYLLSTDLGPVLFNTTEFGWPAKHNSNWMNESTFEACLESDYADETFFLIWHSAESDNWGVLDVAFHVSCDLNYKNTVKQMQQRCILI